MKLERRKNTMRSVGVGVAARVSELVMQFLLRTVFIHTLGVLYLGLNSLFASVLGILNLSELGIGSVLVYSMYKPIAEDDTDTVAALLNLYKRYYHIIGIIIIILGFAITPFITVFIKGDIPPDVNVYILYLINLISTSLSYFLFAYRASLLLAYQRNDLISAADLVTGIIRCAVQIALLFVFKDYYIYLIVVPVMTIIKNLIIAYMTNKRYPQYIKLKSKSFEKNQIADIVKQVKGMIIHKLGQTVFSYADNLVISSFIGLAVLGIYNNYYYIMTAITGMVTILSNSLIAGMGNSVSTNTVEENHSIFMKINFIYYWISVFCSACLIVLYQPFMKLWVGSDKMLDFSTAAWLAFLFYILHVSCATGVIKGALGIWWEDRYRPLLSAGVNLILNLILINIIGINGVIISSVVANTLVDFPYVCVIIDKYYFHRGAFRYIASMYFKHFMAFFVIGITYAMSLLVELEGLFGLIMKGIICVIVSNSLFALINFRTTEFKGAISLMKRTVQKVTAKHR